MFGLVVFGAMVVYLLISIGVVRWAVKHARQKGKSAKRWGWGAALVMYLIPFWDWIPTVATHQYYCAKEAGFWVYKTPEQWKKDNPGVMETLVANEPAPSVSHGDEKNYTDTYFWNLRFNSVIRKDGPFLFNTWRHEQEIVDVKTGDAVGKRVDFSTGDGHVGGELEPRFWMHVDHCLGGRDRAVEFVKIVKQFKGAEK